MNKHLDELIVKAVSDLIHQELGIREKVDFQQYDIPDCLETYQIVTNSDGHTKSLVLSFFVNKEFEATYVHFNRDEYFSMKTFEQFKNKLKNIVGEYKFSLIKPYQLSFIFTIFFQQ